MKQKPDLLNSSINGGKNKNMNSNRMKFKSLGVFLALALCISLVAVALPATPVYADDATDIDITAPTSAALAYVQQGGSVSVTYELTGVGGANTVQIWIYNASGNVGYFSATRASGAPATHTDAVFLDPVVSEGTYSVKATANAIMDTVNGANSVIVDNTEPTVAISYPNGGECFKASTYYATGVVWSDNDNCSTNLVWDLDYSTDNGVSWSDIWAGTHAKGSHTDNWTTPNTNSTFCKVKAIVTDDAGNVGSDTSDAVFTIDNADPTCTLTSPTGGETWDAGSIHNITWDAADSIASNLDYLIEYSTDNGANWTTEDTQTGQTQGSKTYSWTVPGADSILCKVRVTATDCATNSNTSTSATFTIDDTTDPTISVTAPNGGESWAAGSTQTIAWDCTDNVPGNNMTYALYYCTSYSSCTTCATPITTLNNQAQGSRTHSWTVPTPPVGTAPFTTSRVRVLATDVGSNTAEDCSDANFTITVDTTDPTCSITSPTSSSSWQAGTCHQICWTASDDSSSTLTIKLEYNQGGYTEITTLRGVATGANCYYWAVPAAAIGTDTTIRITVTDEAGNFSTCTSDQFAVTAAVSGLTLKTCALAQDWNLVSLQLVPTCTDIESVLGDCIANVLSVWYYSGGPSGSWSSYAPGGPPGLTTMEDGKAYWINMSAGDNWNYQGVKCATGPGSTPPIYNYVAGWNLAGFKRTAATTVDTYLGGTGYTTPIYEYNTGTDTYDSKAGGDNMAICHGYWVYFTEATSVSPGCN